MNLTEKEKKVIEEYRKEIAELSKTDNARYEELKKAIKNIIDELPDLQFVFIQAFKLDDATPCDQNDDEISIRFELSRERLHQVEAKALRRLRHPLKTSGVRDYLEAEPVYVIVEDTVSDEQKALLKSLWLDFSKRLNLLNVDFYFLDAPSELDFSYPDDSKVPKSLFNKNVLLISKTEPCLSWFERSCIIPPRSDGKMVPRYISVQPKILQSNALEKMTGNTVFAYPTLSKFAWFKGAIILCDDCFVPAKEDFDLLIDHFEKKAK
ncbi:MAG: hypothetical protein IJ727_12015 [Treponema sp.]|nr:hypothetical protein [Treponema sp.]